MNIAYLMIPASTVPTKASVLEWMKANPIEFSEQIIEIPRWGMDFHLAEVITDQLMITTLRYLEEGNEEQKQVAVNIRKGVEIIMPGFFDGGYVDLVLRIFEFLLVNETNELKVPYGEEHLYFSGN